MLGIIVASMLAVQYPASQTPTYRDPKRQNFAPGDEGKRFDPYFHLYRFLNLPLINPDGGSSGISAQLCRAVAANDCAAIGYRGNNLCLIVFQQDCSPADRQVALDLCLAHPELPHTEDCHLLWRWRGRLLLLRNPERLHPHEGCRLFSSARRFSRQ
jgi:hypothetical protein